MNPSKSAILASWAAIEGAGAYVPDVLRSAEGVEASWPIWRAALAGMDDAALSAAVAAWISQPGKPSWPSPGQLRALVEKPAPTADDAWGRVLHLIRTQGTSYASPLAPGEEEGEPVPGRRRFRLDDDPAVEARMYRAIQAIGGWASLATLPADRGEQAPTAAAFRRAYDQHTADERRVDVLAEIERRRELAITERKHLSLVEGK